MFRVWGHVPGAMLLSLNSVKLLQLEAKLGILSLIIGIKEQRSRETREQLELGRTPIPADDMLVDI